MTITDSVIRIGIGSPDLKDTESWAAIDRARTEKWWFVDALDYLASSGCRIEARSKRDEWDVALTWDRAAVPT